jgi:hypothetical protein
VGNRFDNKLWPVWARHLLLFFVRSKLEGALFGGKVFYLFLSAQKMWQQAASLWSRAAV